MFSICQQVHLPPYWPTKVGYIAVNSMLFFFLSLGCHPGWVWLRSWPWSPHGLRRLPVLAGSFNCATHLLLVEGERGCHMITPHQAVTTFKVVGCGVQLLNSQKRCAFLTPNCSLMDFKFGSQRRFAGTADHVVSVVWQDPTWRHDASFEVSACTPASSPMIKHAFLRVAIHRAPSLLW